MTAIAIIAPDGNRVVGLFADMPLAELETVSLDDKRVMRVASIETVNDWPFHFERIWVSEPNGWRAYEPDDLPMQYW